VAAPSKSIFIQQPTPVVNWDTTVVIGQPTPLNAYAGSGFSYTWTPLVTYLNCDTCRTYNPISTTTTDITYSVMVEDGHQCSVIASTFKIHVEIKVSLDVPTAFTPNGDGTNDIIYPGGWGIRKLNYFKIFNRWGQLVFETNDLSIGWDGVFQGVPQNMETYVYQVSADTYSDKEPTLSKTGTFKLLR
jgi:gliding motility-associated-like protein